MNDMPEPCQPLTPQEFYDWIASMDLPPNNTTRTVCPADWRVVCRLLGCARGTLYNWLRGSMAIPPRLTVQTAQLSMLRRIAKQGTATPADIAGLNEMFYGEEHRNAA